MEISEKSITVATGAMLQKQSEGQKWFADPSRLQQENPGLKSLGGIELPLIDDSGFWLFLCLHFYQTKKTEEVRTLERS